MKIAPFVLERYFARHEFVAPHLLCCSDCETVSVEDVLAAAPDAREQFFNLSLGYTESRGSPELREAIAGLYENIDPSHVLVHAGAEEAIFIFMNVLLDPGDHIIVHAPCYQSLFEIARSIGCEITLWEAGEEDGWRLDPGFVADHIRPNTRAVIVNCPHNPTGYVMAQTEFREMAALSQRHGFVLFSDEVYRWLEYDAKDRLPAACDLNPDAVSLGVMSKSFGLAGLRIGWVATRNAALLDRMAAFKDYTTICSSAPSEFLACTAIGHRDYFFKRNLSIIQENLQRLTRFFEQYASWFGWTMPKGGPIAFPYLKNDIPIDRFCERVLEKQGVLLLPGSVYSISSNHFRIGFGRKNFASGLAALEAFMAALEE